MTDRPLAGRRVVVTRAAHQAASLVERLSALGADPIVVPLIEVVEPTDQGAALTAALGRIDQYDWVVVTSPNGADRVAGALDQSDAEPMIAAVGTATAASFRRHVDLIADDQIGDGLAAAFPAGTGKVLLAQSEEARRVVAAGLRAKGWVVDVVATHRTEALRPTAKLLLTTLSADVVLFASGSAVRAWVESFGQHTPALVVAIGPATAAVADQLGLKIDVVAADHSVDGLVDSVLTILGDSD